MTGHLYYACIIVVFDLLSWKGTYLIYENKHLYTYFFHMKKNC